MPVQLPELGARHGSSGSVAAAPPPSAEHRPSCPARVASLVNRARDLDGQADDEDPGSSRPSSAYSGAKGVVGSRPGSGSARPGSAGSSVQSFYNGRTQPVPGPPAWWLGSGRESPATGLAGREAKHTSKYQAFAQRAELLLASIDESVQRSTVATHIQGRTQMIDVATFWDAWEGEIPPEGSLPEWRPYSGPFLNAGRVHPNSLPLSFRVVIRNRTQRTILTEASTASFPTGMASVVYNDTPMAPGMSQDLILTVDPSKGTGEVLADLTISCEATTTVQESHAAGAELLVGDHDTTFSLRESQGMDRSAVSGRSGSTNASMGQSQQNSKLSGTRMVEYTTGVHVPLYIWMDPYADFE